MLDTTLLHETVSDVNHLLGYLHDSHIGYQKSADVVEDNQLKKELMNAATRRKEMISAVESVVANNNQKPTHHGTLLGATHRMFVEIKSLFTGHKSHTILHEIERAENILAAEYRHTLEKISHPEIRRLLERQLASICEDLTQWEVNNLKIHH